MQLVGLAGARNERSLQVYGTTARNTSAAKMTRCAMPGSTVVRPVPKVTTPTNSVSASSTSSIRAVLCDKIRRNGNRTDHL